MNIRDLKAFLADFPDDHVVRVRDTKANQGDGEWLDIQPDDIDQFIEVSRP